MSKHGVKGSHIIQAKVAVDDKLGAGTFSRFVRQAGGDGSWDHPAVSAWYDVFVLQRVFGITSHETGISVAKLATEIGRRNALSDLNTIYRMFLRVAQPVRMLHFGPQLWRNYVQFGEARNLRNELGEFEATIAEVPATLIPWVEGSALGFIPTGIEVAGGVVDKALITQSISNGDHSSVTFEVRYRVK
jgi:hypothetical protein